ncbi:tail fiber assembly protein, partial [Pseudodesulfovibrio pelocollis]|uniref:tail fiber assembly protein n=1 Tax=Pseudodesulfovibrio pelocollis TaxID=3051432 RepID=UPI00255AE429
AERDRLLAGCDWTQLADAPLSEDERDAWTLYRQELRDVPQQPGFPGVVAWPQVAEPAA